MNSSSNSNGNTQLEWARKAHTQNTTSQKCDGGVGCLPASERTNQLKESSTWIVLWSEKWEKRKQPKRYSKANRENRRKKNFLTNTKYTRQTEHTYSIQCAAHGLMATRVSCRKAYSWAKHRTLCTQLKCVAKKHAHREREHARSVSEGRIGKKRTVARRASEARLWLQSRILWKTRRPRWNRWVLCEWCFLIVVVIVVAVGVFYSRSQLSSVLLCVLCTRIKLFCPPFFVRVAFIFAIRIGRSLPLFFSRVCNCE